MTTLLSNEYGTRQRVPLRIFVLCTLYFVLCLPAFAADATLYISPITGKYTIGTVFPLRVMVSSGGDPVNAVEGQLTFDPKEIEVIDAPKDGSVLTSWTIAPTYNNDEGTLTFGGLLATSTVLDRGLVLSFTVRAKRSGEMRIHFATGAAVHAADGTGGNLLSTLNGGIYSITPKEGVLDLTTDSVIGDEPTSSVVSFGTTSDAISGEVLGAATGTPITSTTHPNQSQWYALATSTINWEIPEGLARVRLALDKKPSGEGIVPYDIPKREKILTHLNDGVWYVHLTREFIDGKTDLHTYRLNIDTVAPTSLTVSEKPRDSGTNPNAIFLVSATDTSSGIDHYMFAIDGGTPVSWVPDWANEYHAPALKVGAHKLTVFVVDRAGNKSAETQIQFTIEYLATPTLALNAKQFTEGDHLSLSLVSVPGAVMSVHIQGGGQTANEDFVVDANGRGQFISKIILLPGTYEVWGTAQSVDGALSRESEHVQIEVHPSLIGIVKRHQLIPLAIAAFFIFLYCMRVLWKKLRHDDAVLHVDEVAGEGDDVVPEPPIRPMSSGTVVLGALKPKQKDRSGSIVITR